MFVVDEVNRHTVDAPDKSKTEGIIVMWAAGPNPPQVGGVKPTPKTSMGSPRRTFGTVVERATERASAG